MTLFKKGKQKVNKVYKHLKLFFCALKKRKRYPNNFIQPFWSLYSIFVCRCKALHVYISFVLFRPLFRGFWYHTIIKKELKKI